MPANKVEKLLGVPGLTDNVVGGLGEQAGDPLPQEDVVVGDDDGAPSSLAGFTAHRWSMRNFRYPTYSHGWCQRAISSASSDCRTCLTANTTVAPQAALVVAPVSSLRVAGTGCSRSK